MTWTTVVPTVVTGVVGLAGIGGSILSAKLAGSTATANLLRSINAEDKRTHLSEKRRTYAAALESFEEMGLFIATLRSAKAETLVRDMPNAVDKLTGAGGAMWGAVTKLQLIGSPEVAEAAQDLADEYLGHGRSMLAKLTGTEQEPAYLSVANLGQLTRDLADAMRADLGEPDQT